jgi:RNA 3'-terminal phosphate cyclase (ATP)
MITVDGSLGEGGGQVLRTSLGLSLVTGKPFRVTNIRAGRAKPGLMRQHLTAVRAAKQIGRAQVQGDRMRSGELTFKPGKVKGGKYEFSVGTAGSATLVLQTVLPALLIAPEPSELVMGGGTHNPFAPPFDFLAKAFLPLVAKMGAKVEVELRRPGFYPAGGGEFVVRIQPAETLEPIHLLERGKEIDKRALAVVASLPEDICRRELRMVTKRLNWPPEKLESRVVEGSAGPGNVIMLEMSYENVTELFTGFGTRGRPAGSVADRAIEEARAYLVCGAPVGLHLADQLLVPLALAGGGSFRTGAPSRHTLTNAEVIGKFVRIDVKIEKEEERTWKVEVEKR